MRAPSRVALYRPVDECGAPIIALGMMENAGHSIYHIILRQFYHDSHSSRPRHSDVFAHLFAVRCSLGEESAALKDARTNIATAWLAIKPRLSLHGPVRRERLRVVIYSLAAAFSGWNTAAAVVV